VFAGDISNLRRRNLLSDSSDSDWDEDATAASIATAASAPWCTDPSAVYKPLAFARKNVAAAHVCVENDAAASAVNDPWGIGLSKAQMQLLHADTELNAVLCLLIDERVYESRKTRKTRCKLARATHNRFSP
jgi:hypothetical protein